MTFINTLLGLFTQKRLSQIDYFKAHPVKVQRDTWQELLTRGKSTEYGKRHAVDDVLDVLHGGHARTNAGDEAALLADVVRRFFRIEL